MRMNIGRWIARSAARHRGRHALRCDGRELTYDALAERVDRLANGLRAVGLVRGARVALLLHNGPELVEAVFACASAGLVAVPLNWRLGAAEQAFIVRDCEPRALICDHELLGAGVDLAQASPTIGLCLRTGDGGEAVGARFGGYDDFVGAADPTPHVDPAVGGDDAHVILYTSGTTGLPKGVVLSHDNTFWQAANAMALGLAPGSTSLVVLPLFHAGGLNGAVTPVLHVGGTIILPRRFDPAAVLATITEHRVDGMLAVPAVYRALVASAGFADADLSSLTALVSGGAPLPEDLVALFDARGIPLRQGYGLTETAPGATGMGPGDHWRKRGTVGRPCQYTDVRVVDDEGSPLPCGEAGEVEVRGPNVMLGYWRRPEETARVMRDGWFRTGDVGRFDGDGFLTLVDRLKNMIISGGENVYPAEVERCLLDHPEVEEAAVRGAPDPRWGEVCVAFVTPTEGSAPAADALRAWCRERIAAYKVPARVHLRGPLPRNALGKVVLAALEEP